MLEGPKKIKRVVWPYLVGAFEAVLAGSRLGKLGVFYVRRFTNNVPTLRHKTQYASFAHAFTAKSKCRLSTHWIQRVEHVAWKGFIISR